MACRLTCLPSWYTPAWRAGSLAGHAGVHQLGKQAHLPAMLVYTSLARRLTRRPCWCTPAWREGSPVGLSGVHQLGKQVRLFAKLVYTSSARRLTCWPCWCTPARPKGEPVRQAGVHQLGKQAHLLALLVYTSLASRLTCRPCWCTAAWRAGEPVCRAGVHQHGRQTHLLAKLLSVEVSSDTSLVGRVPSICWCAPASVSADLLAKQATHPAQQAGCNVLSKQDATCSPSRLQPACQALAGCNLLAKQAETCSPTRLQAAGGGQLQFPANQTRASHSKSWLMSDSPGIGLGDRQQRQRLLSSSSPQKQQRPLAAALGPCQRPLLSRVLCQPQQLPSCCFCGWLQSNPRGIGQEPGTGGATWFLLWLAKAGLCPIPGELEWSQPKQEPNCSCCGWLLSDSPGIGLGCPQQPLHSSLQPARQAGSSLQPAQRAGSSLKPAWQAGSILKPARQAGSILKPARRAGSIFKPARRAGACCACKQ
ncbi:hypothetical protein PCANC_19170 [Puccinia coronata f. sp. avenae]|uniref:Uncharacterized protein n=1 Tax=Puccinia coronata f. sp. avenae TaxID=200324 RepID=A0A2N5U2G6_9BASI|nr:hypothetical protein PCANC_19170 [Puccinia coronata f. sp. avenae]